MEKYIRFFDGQVVFPNDLNYMQEQEITYQQETLNAILESGIFRSDVGDDEENEFQNVNVIRYLRYPRP